MAQIPRDDEREERIQMEIIVDCYGSEEQVMGWYNYLNDFLLFPFAAQCAEQRAISPLEPGDKVNVIGMAADEDCERNMLVLIEQKRRPLAVPLAQLVGVKVDEETEQAIADWRYWVQRGYQF